jgi:hypothetical protein
MGRRNMKGIRYREMQRKGAWMGRGKKREKS